MAIEETVELTSEEVGSLPQLSWDIQFKRPDGSYLIKLPGLDVLYHVEQNDNPELFAEINAAAKDKDIPLEPEPEQPPLTVDDFRNAIQWKVDGKAQERRYDSGNSLASYVNSTIPAWKEEAKAFVAWRDQVWAYAYAELEKVQNGERDEPTIKDFLAELPELVWS